MKKKNLYYKKSWKNILKGEPLKKENGKLYFRETSFEKDVNDSFDRVKSFFKDYPRFYYFLKRLISPVYNDLNILKKFLDSSSEPGLNIGSGNQPRFKSFLNVDMIDYENVDIVCNIDNLPFKNESIKSVINLGVLEHVENPKEVLDEIYRILAPGGYLMSTIPFLQPFHASPHDYQRYTYAGIKKLHSRFKILKSGVYSGPFSALLWVLQETIASTFSLGFPNVRNILIILLMLISWPIKYLDLFFIPLATSKNIASNFYIIAKKI